MVDTAIITDGDYWREIVATDGKPIPGSGRELDPLEVVCWQLALSDKALSEAGDAGRKVQIEYSQRWAAEPATPGG